MIDFFLTPILSWLGISLIPFLLLVIIIILLINR